MFIYFPRDGLLQPVPINSFRMTDTPYYPSCSTETTCQRKVSAPLIQTLQHKRLHAATLLCTRILKKEWNKVGKWRCRSLFRLMIKAVLLWRSERMRRAHNCNSSGIFISTWRAGCGLKTAFLASLSSISYMPGLKMWQRWSWDGSKWEEREDSGAHWVCN